MLITFLGLINNEYRPNIGIGKTNLTSKMPGVCCLLYVVLWWSVLSLTDKLTSSQGKNILESFYSCHHIIWRNLILYFVHFSLVTKSWYILIQIKENHCVIKRSFYTYLPQTKFFNKKCPFSKKVWRWKTVKAP